MKRLLFGLAACLVIGIPARYMVDARQVVAQPPQPPVVVASPPPGYAGYRDVRGLS